ncbi:hypothetical protein RSWS8N_08790 [Cereibacter sphaeroides WS8N]|uniref:DUF2339 domain-containing protein n=1 Tax=Cereibacter sphaeroides TaxID=1063 RepID=UPI00020DF21D|nr:DUF2339 domain-containing protein [Cereibacter sphaeroides]EGJ22166.1 hypothetical protein RSWS8N_08790 [Cereibacter sphaeroides WS8N]
MNEDFFILMGVLLAAVLLATPIATLVLTLRQRRLSARVAKLEEALEAALAGPGPAPAEAPRAEPLPQPERPPADMIEAVGPWARAGRAAASPSPEAPDPRETALSEPGLSGPASGDLPPPDRARPEGPGRISALSLWLRSNWAFTLSAVSLALAGIFFVQYGIEQGLLPPALRVAAAVGFGGALVAAGEWIRRRGGDGEEAPALLLPSTFSAAGLVSIYGGIVAGRLLYGLYGPELTLVGLVATTLGAVLLGWRHGPFLAAMGLVGAGAAPFLVAGGQGATAALYPYYLLVAFLGLAVDAFRLWRWVSVLALAIGTGGAFLMYLGGAGQGGWALTLGALVLLAVVVPGRAPVPEHAAPAPSERLTAVLFARGADAGPRLSVPVRLALGMAAAASFALWYTVEGFWSFGTLAALAVGLVVLSLRAPGIGDLALLPAAAFLLRLWTDLWMASQFTGLALGSRPPETSPPATGTALLALAAVMSVAFAGRAFGSVRRPLALGAVLTAPVAAALLEFRWAPGLVLGSLPWALHVMAVAALMTWFAVHWSRLEDRRPMAWAILSALASVSLALFLLLDAAALTLALAVLVVAAAWLDRRLRLVEMGWFLQAGVAAISYRLVVDPGLVWARFAPALPMLAAFAGAIAAVVGARRLLPPERRLERAVAESAAAAWAALLVNVLLTRRFPLIDPVESVNTHWFLTLQALPWLVVAGAQLWRIGAGGRIDLLRRIVAAGAFALALMPLGLAVTTANPLGAGLRGEILGLPILDTLLLAYALPGALFLLGARHLPGLGRLQSALAALGGAFLLLWAVLEIRRLWHGPRIDAPGVLQGELYSYTVALLAGGAVLLWQAVRLRSELLRRLAMAVLALTVAKVFLWDAAGLSGLVRVLSFFCLGLVLAGMAWLNTMVRRAMAGDQGRS